MSQQTVSEALFERLCSSRGVSWKRIPIGPNKTPDYEINLAGTRVLCEIKQINPNQEDQNELKALRTNQPRGRLVPKRLRKKLKDVSGQLKAAALSDQPTILVVYDNTPFKMYSQNEDVRQAMFGNDSVAVSNAGGALIVSAPFIGGDRGFTPNQNTSVSALAILEDSPESLPTLTVYHNRYAEVILRPELLAALAHAQHLA
jgi:hypothetical protein